MDLCYRQKSPSQLANLVERTVPRHSHSWAPPSANPTADPSSPSGHTRLNRIDQPRRRLYQVSSRKAPSSPPRPSPQPSPPPLYLPHTTLLTIDHRLHPLERNSARPPFLASATRQDLTRRRPIRASPRHTTQRTRRTRRDLRRARPISRRTTSMGRIIHDLPSRLRGGTERPIEAHLLSLEVGVED